MKTTAKREPTESPLPREVPSEAEVSAKAPPRQLSSEELMPSEEQELNMRKDFRVFLYYVWVALGLKEPTPLQYDMAHYLQHSSKREVIMAFRGVGKTWITGAYATWRVWNNPLLKVLIVSGSGEHAKKVSAFVRELFALLPVLQHLEPGSDDTDITNRFNVAGIPPAVQPSFSSIGITGQLAGNRSNLLIADDVENITNSYTVHQREKLWECVKEFDAILNSDEDTDLLNRIIYLGTPQTEETLYGTLVKDRGYSCRIWPARVPENLAKYRGNLAPMVLTMGPAGTPTDPQRFNETDLVDRELSYGRSGFARQFMLDPELGDADRFPLKLADLIVTSVDVARAPSYIAWTNDMRYALEDTLSMGIGGDRFYRPMKISDDWVPYTGTVMAVDPAGKGADRVGYAIVKHLHGSLFASACGGLQGGYEDDNMKALAMLAKIHGVNLILCEPNYGGGMFTASLKKFVTKIHPCAVEDSPHSVGQKERRIIDILEPVMNQHRLVFSEEIVRSDIKQEDRNHSLFYQLTRLTYQRGCLKHDDAVDALAIAVSHWTENMAQDQEESHADMKLRALAESMDDWENEIKNMVPKAQMPSNDTFNKLTRLR